MRGSIETVAQAGCAMCIFEMAEVDDCRLAVKIDGRAYLVTGCDIDDHGDAHASTGLCNAPSRAEVGGRIEEDTFVATKLDLLP